MSNEVLLALIAAAVTLGGGIGWIIRQLFARYDESNKSGLAIRDDMIERQRKREEQIMPAMKNVVDAVENVTATLDSMYGEQKLLREDHDEICSSLGDIQRDVKILKHVWGEESAG